MDGVADRSVDGPPGEARPVQDRRRARSAQWTAQAPRVRGARRCRVRAVADVAAHEQDIRGALGKPGARDNDAIDVRRADVPRRDGQGRWRAHGWRRSRSARTATRCWPGRPTPGRRDEADHDAFELFRAVLGRRSRAQVVAMGWTGDPTPYLEHFFVFGPAATTSSSERDRSPQRGGRRLRRPGGAGRVLARACSAARSTTTTSGSRCTRPAVSSSAFQQVPEPKVVKNRVHLDVDGRRHRGRGRRRGGAGRDHGRRVVVDSGEQTSR